MQGPEQMLDVCLVIVKVRRDSQIIVTAGNDNVVLCQTGYQAVVIAGPAGKSSQRDVPDQPETRDCNLLLWPCP